MYQASSNPKAKTLPHDIKTEQAVLGALLIDRNALTEVLDILHADCFYCPNHRLIYQKAICPLFLENTGIDTLTVIQKLKEQKLLEGTLNDHFICELTNQVYSTAHIVHHSLILKQFAIKRKVIRFCNETLRDAWSPDSDSLELLDRSAEKLDRIGSQLIHKPFSTMDQIIRENVKEIQIASESDATWTGVPSGFTELDQITGGWQQSDLIIMAARPGMGKTTWALNVAEFAAMRQGVTTAIFSLEMSCRQLGKRALSSITQVPLQKLQSGDLQPGDWNALRLTTPSLTQVPIFVDDTAGISIFEIKTKLRRLKHEQPGLGLVIIDYLQLINGIDPENKNQNREQQISYISRSLKALAKEFDVPVIALSQLSRNVESRGGDKRPMLSDLRESGAIEADADLVLFLYRPEYYRIFEDATGKDIRGQALLIVAKHRNGSPGEVKLGFIPERSEFCNP